MCSVNKRGNITTWSDCGEPRRNWKLQRNRREAERNSRRKSVNPSPECCPRETWAAGEVRNVQRAVALDRTRPDVAETPRTGPAGSPCSHHDPDQRRERHRKELFGAANS